MSGELQNSNLMGRWSFSLQTVGGGPQVLSSLLMVQGLEPWESQQWVVSLIGHKYTGGLLPVGATQPTDNQVYSGAQFVALVEWGVDGALETAEVDYPTGGATFQVQASTLRIGVRSLSNNFAPFPLLSGFVAPGTKLATITQCPARTLFANLAGSPATSLVPKPKRATAYRVWPAGLSTSTISILELDGSSSLVLKNDGRRLLDAGAAGAVFFDAGNQMAWTPLHPQCQFLQLADLDVTGVGVYIEFLLDLG
jgi:hypothetical protein